ncbi:beta-ketoacyl-ACP synthase II [Herpetosiphon sp. NSE202]|uniref:beta-ketoacyl-ACP synthase II n=1 Tax=Herpetosiphon sp. NSE202 TaxID=3351349 RepID=UPI0036442DB4
MNRRVVVTGLGAISPLGLDVPSLWEGIVQARSAVRRITQFDPTHFSAQIAAEVHGFEAANYMDKKEARRNSRFVHFAVAAAKEALRSADLTITDENADDVGVIIGCGVGGLDNFTTYLRVMDTKGPDRITPFLIPMMIVDMAGGVVAIEIGARGPNFCPVSACATSGNAIGEAWHVIRRGEAKVILAGGTEAAITEIGIGAFASARALSTRNDDPATASRPFDKDRDGFVMGEGSGVLVLEDYEHAVSRGATILAELVGYGVSTDAYHITMPAEDGSGAVKAMRMALRHAGLEPHELGYLNAHGTSTPVNDRTETLAIKKVFGDYTAKLPISSNKSQIGHTLGAGGAIEAVIGIRAMQEGLIPATINYHTPDPECEIDCVPNTPRQAQFSSFMSNSFGFGGHNVSLLFKAFEA